MRRLSCVLIALALFACGGQAATPPATPTTPTSNDPANLPKALGKPRVVVEYVVIHEKWVEKTMTPNTADVSAWIATPEGKAAVPPERREMTFGTKKEADGGLARAKKGEIVADDAPRASAADAAYEKLTPGDATIVSVSPKQFVVVTKAAPTEAAIEKAYKKAKAAETAQKLAVALLSRLQKSDADARAVIAEVVGEILGEKAVADPDRPQPVVIDDDRLRHARLAPKAKESVSTMLKTAKPGETVSAPIVDGPISTVARALPPSDR